METQFTLLSSSIGYTCIFNNIQTLLIGISIYDATMKYVN